MGATAQAHRVIPSGRSDKRYEREPRHLPLEWLLPILALFVTIAIGIGVAALTSRPSTGPLRGDVATLHRDVVSLQHRLAVDHGALLRAQSKLAALQKTAAGVPTAGRVNSLGHRVDELNFTFDMLAVCLPQLQQEVAGMTIQTQDTSGWLTGAALVKPTVMSGACASALSVLPGRR
jgi:hypothetical protein